MANAKNDKVSYLKLILYSTSKEFEWLPIYLAKWGLGGKDFFDALNNNVFYDNSCSAGYQHQPWVRKII